MTPLISVILPCYNGSRYVEQAINSVKNQSFGDWELIIINDGSTDNSESILKSLCDRDLRMRYYSQKNIGLARTLNRGIDLSFGQLIARIDCDDIWSDPEKLQKQAALLLSEDDTVLVGTSMNLINELGVLKKSIPITCINAVDAIDKLTSKKRFFPHSSIMFKKKFMNKRINYRTNLKLAEDFDLYLRLCKIGNIKSIKDIFTDIRINETSLTFGEAASLSILDSLAAIKSFYTQDNYANFDVEDDDTDLRKDFEKVMDVYIYKLYCRFALGNIYKKIYIAIFNPYFIYQYLFFRKKLIKKIIQL